MVLETAVTNMKVEEAQFSDCQRDVMKLTTSEEQTSSQIAISTCVTNIQDKYGNVEKYITRRYIVINSAKVAEITKQYYLSSNHILFRIKTVNNGHCFIVIYQTDDDTFLTADHCQKFGLDWLSTYDCLEGLDSRDVAQWSSTMLTEGENIHTKGWSGAPIIVEDQILAFEGLDVDGNICTRKNYNQVDEFCSDMENKIIDCFKNEPRIKLTGYDCDIIQSNRGVYTDPNQIITRVVHRDGPVTSFHGFPGLCMNKILPTVEKGDIIEVYHDGNFVTGCIEKEYFQFHCDKQKLIYGVVPAFYCKEILQCGSPIFKDKKLVSVITQCYDEHYYTVSGISDFSGHIRTESYDRKIVESGEAVYGVTSAPYAVIKALATEKSNLEPAGSSTVTLFAFKTQVRTDVTVTTENGVELLHLRYKASMTNKPCM